MKPFLFLLGLILVISGLLLTVARIQTGLLKDISSLKNLYPRTEVLGAA